MKQIIEKLSWLPYQIKNKYLYKRSEFVTVKPKGFSKEFSFPFQIIIDKNFHSLSRNLQSYGIREPRNVSEFIKFVDSDDIVLDVGANIGFFTILAKKAKKIIAIEPVEECIPILKENLKNNNITNVDIFNVALGDGMPLLIKKEDQTNLSKVVYEIGENVKEIKSQNLDHFVKKDNINFIKIDAEGFEYEIFGKQIIPEKINKIFMEFHTGLMGNLKSIELIKNLYKEGFFIETLVEDLPLRLYPFMNILWKKMTYVKKNLNEEEAINEITKGRSIKYLYFRKNFNGFGHQNFHSIKKLAN